MSCMGMARSRLLFILFESVYRHRESSVPVVTTMWVNRLLQVSQLGQLSLSSFRGR